MIIIMFIVPDKNTEAHRATKNIMYNLLWVHFMLVPGLSALSQSLQLYEENAIIIPFLNQSTDLSD